VTLAKVVKKWRSPNAPVSGAERPVVDEILAQIEADPDFLLRDRVEALIADLERPYEPGLDQPTAKGIARRLREDLLLFGKMGAR
jgi:hypothetical protein